MGRRDATNDMSAPLFTARSDGPDRVLLRVPNGSGGFEEHVMDAAAARHLISTLTCAVATCESKTSAQRLTPRDRTYGEKGR